MIKLKTLLIEANLIGDKAGFTIKGGLGSKDPWEYYWHNNKQKWYTKKNTSAKWLDMQNKLVMMHGSKRGNMLYDKAKSNLEKYLHDNAAASAANVVVEPTTIPDNQLETIPVNADVADIDRVLFKVNAEKHPVVVVRGKTEDGKYLQINNPRKFALNKIVYVDANNFKIAGDGSADYIGGEKSYNLYKISESVVNEQLKPSMAPIDKPFTLSETDPYEYYLDKKTKTWYTKLKTEPETAWKNMKQVAGDYNKAVKKLEAGPRYSTKKGTDKPDSKMEKWQDVKKPSEVKSADNSFNSNRLSIFKNYNLYRPYHVDFIGIQPKRISNPIDVVPYLVRVEFGPNSGKYSNKNFYVKIQDLDSLRSGNMYDIFGLELNDDKYTEEMTLQVTNHILQNFKILSKTSDGAFYLVQIGTDKKYLIPQAYFDINGKFKSNKFSAYELKTV
jgi:hypothetical protein